MKCSFKYCNSKINHDAQSGMCGSDCNFDADISVCNWEDVSGGGEDNFDWSVARGSLKPWTGETVVSWVLRWMLTTRPPQVPPETSPAPGPRPEVTPTLTLRGRGGRATRRG